MYNTGKCNLIYSRLKYQKKADTRLLCKTACCITLRSDCVHFLLYKKNSFYFRTHIKTDFQSYLDHSNSFTETDTQSFLFLMCCFPSELHNISCEISPPNVHVWNLKWAYYLNLLYLHIHSLVSTNSSGSLGTLLCSFLFSQVQIIISLYASTVTC